MRKARCSNKRILSYRTQGNNRQIREIRTLLCEFKQQLNRQEEQLSIYHQQLTTQQEILNLFYGEYQLLKKRLGKAPLMEHIRMRDSMIKDMAKYEEQRQTNTMGYRLLGMYVNELTELLEDQSVEILSGKPGIKYDPEIQKPIDQVRTTREDEDSVVHKVYNCGYRWNGIMLKKMDVCVCVYK